MGEILDAFKSAFRRYNIDGLADSGDHRPDKADARALGGTLEDIGNLGIVNLDDEVTIDDTFNVPNTFPAAYLITDKGTPADYVITLPGGADDGALVFFRVAVTATKLFTVWDSGPDMEGDDRVVLIAGESIMLRKVDGFWKRVGGRPVPITAILRRTASQSLTTGVAADIVFQEALVTPRGQSFGLSLNTFRAPRDGIYRVTVNLSTTGSGAAQESRLRLAGQTPPSPATVPAAALSCQYGFTGSPRLTHCLTGHFPLQRNATVTATVLVTGTSPAIEYAAGVVECILYAEEIIT